jgi:hypothetical protein
VTFLQLFVNKFSFTSKLSFLAYLGFTTPNFYHLQFAFALWRRSATVAINFTGAHRAPLQTPLQKMCNYLLKLV